MYCIRCGKQLADGTKYCIYCGAPTAAPKKDEHVSTEDDFTIAVPKGYVQSDASGMDATQHISFGKDFVPDPAEEYMPEGLQDEIGQVIDEELGEREQAEHEYTRAVSREDLACAMEQARPDEDSELQQYVQDVMTSEHTRPAERETAAPEDEGICGGYSGNIGAAGTGTETGAGGTAARRQAGYRRAAETICAGSYGGERPRDAAGSG